MSRSQATVLIELLAIGPQGDGMPVNGQPGVLWPLWLGPQAAEISRFEGYAEEMLIEIDPGTSNYLLPDYIRLLGPDPYGRDTVPLTTAQQQALALQRYTARGGASIDYFVDAAAQIGLTITITETTVGECGAMVCGDPLSINPQQFYWLVTMPAVSEGTFAGNAVQTQISTDAPAHTQPVFSYTG
jgi:uncharacterized protein YmfQ (DUF2313 family)